MRNTAYSITITDQAKEDLINYIDYIAFHYQEYFAIQRIIEDYYEALQSLRMVGDIYDVCNFPKAQKEGIRRIRLKRYKYYLFFVIKDNEITVVRGFQARQNYQRLL